jgi:predicted RNA-binding protein with PUA-like domain
LKHPVPLDTIKGETKLKDMVLVNNSRLSVQPVTEAEWKLICKMGGL